MAASRTLYRKSRHFQSRPDEARPAAKGTRSRSVRTLREPTRHFPYALTYHATKGWRQRRVALSQIEA